MPPIPVAWPAQDAATVPTRFLASETLSALFIFLLSGTGIGRVPNRIFESLGPTTPELR
jgi:hypothetical protein